MNKTFEIVWPRPAFIDLDIITDYICLHTGPKTALKIYKKIEKQIETLTRYPFRCRIVPELKEHGILDYRDLIITPYRVCYKIIENKVILTAILDGRRNIEQILLDRIMKL